MVPGSLNTETGRYEQGAAFVHKGFITALHADAPARAMLLSCVGSFTAILACIWCSLTGKRIAGTTRYTAYCEPQTASAGPGAGQAYQMGVNDDTRRHDSGVMQQLMNDAQEVRQAGGVLASSSGFHGMSPLFTHLAYMDVRTISIVPFMHAFGQGVLKDLLKALFKSPRTQQPRRQHQQQQPGPPPAGMHGTGLARARAPPGKRQRADEGTAEQPQGAGPSQQQQQQAADDTGALAPAKRIGYAQRRVIAQRAAACALHPQINRPMRNIVKHHAGMHMDELAAGITGLFGLLLWPTRDSNGHLVEVLHDPVVKKAWGHLRRFAVFHLSVQDCNTRSEYEVAARAAQDELLEYCKLVEQVGVQTVPLGRVQACCRCCSNAKRRD